MGRHVCRPCLALFKQAYLLSSGEQVVGEPIQCQTRGHIERKVSCNHSSNSAFTYVFAVVLSISTAAMTILQLSAALTPSAITEYGFATATDVLGIECSMTDGGYSCRNHCTASRHSMAHSIACMRVQVQVVSPIMSGKNFRMALVC